MLGGVRQDSHAATATANNKMSGAIILIKLRIGSHPT